MIGYGFWQQRLAGAQDVIGKQIRIEGRPFTIIGVTRKWFTGMTPGELPDVTIPITAMPLISGSGSEINSLEDRSKLWVRITGRLKDGVTLAQARAQLQSFWPEVLLATASTQTPGLRRQTFLSMGLDVGPVSTGVADDLRTQFSRPLYVLSGIVGLILLVACLNLANLMLARAAARSQEMSVRVAIGASRWALAAQVLTESLVVSLAGAFLGLILSYWGSHLLEALMTEGTVSLDLRPDLHVLSVAVGVVLLTTILFGLAPAWRSSRQDPGSVLQQGSRGVAGGAGKLGKMLIVSQVALSLVLLLGAGLLVGTFQKLRALDLGFDKDNLLEITLNAKPGGYQNLDLNSYHKQLIERVSKLPGVLSVSLADLVIPALEAGQEQQKVSAISEDPNTGFHVMAYEATVWPGFLNTLGIRLLNGRSFELTDDEKHPHLAIVSKSLAERLFPHGDAIGRHVRWGFWPEFQNLEIVGVAEDARIFDLRSAAPPVIYLSYVQAPQWSQWGEFYVRTNENPEALVNTIGREVDSLGHEYTLRTLSVEQNTGRVLVNERIIALLSTFFAALALLLASIRLYGLMSYGVSRRTREIGVRVALGAQQKSVRWMILRETLALTFFGIAIGIPSGLAASRLIASMLFGLSPNDLPTIATSCLLLFVVGLFAGYLPARRASSVDPILVLRIE